MSPISEFSKSAEVVAVCVGREDKILTHSGLLYRTGDTPEELRWYFLHLGGPLELKNDNEQPSYNSNGYLVDNSHYIWLPLKCEDEEKNLLASKCLLISQKNKRLPYSIIHDEETTFCKDGSFKLSISSFGLTCSSFVKAVLKSQNINIIDDTDWPDNRDSDEDWAEYMFTKYGEIIQGFLDKIKTLREQVKDSNDNNFKNIVAPATISKYKEYIEIFEKAKNGIKRDKNTCFKRYRPEEVVGTANCELTDMPVKFKYEDDTKVGAEKIGADLLAMLPEKSDIQ